MTVNAQTYLFLNHSSNFRVVTISVPLIHNKMQTQKARYGLNLLKFALKNQDFSFSTANLCIYLAHEQYIRDPKLWLHQYMTDPQLWLQFFPFSECAHEELSREVLPILQHHRDLQSAYAELKLKHSTSSALVIVGYE